MVNATLISAVHTYGDELAAAKGLSPYIRPTQLSRVYESATPAATATFQPIPHGRILDAVCRSVSTSGFEIGRQAHQLSHNDQRYHGVLELIQTDKTRQTPSLFGDGDDGSRTILLGLRNSHDKSNPFGLVSGTHVRVCSNGLFNGQVEKKTKHTRYIDSRLDRLIDEAVGEFLLLNQKQGEQIAMYKQYQLSDEEAYAFVGRSIDRYGANDGAICASKSSKVYKAYFTPPHPEFAERNLWSLVNAFTEVYNEMSIENIVDRSKRLHHMADMKVGLATAA